MEKKKEGENAALLTFDDISTPNEVYRYRNAFNGIGGKIKN